MTTLPVSIGSDVQIEIGELPNEDVMIKALEARIRRHREGVTAEQHEADLIRSHPELAEQIAVNGDSGQVRPTKLCLTMLGVKIPPAEVRLSEIDHGLVRVAQRLPQVHAAGGAERILSLSDRLWFKVKTTRWRGAATVLSPVHPAPWWLGAGG